MHLKNLFSLIAASPDLTSTTKRKCYDALREILGEKEFSHEVEDIHEYILPSSALFGALVDGTKIPCLIEKEPKGRLRYAETQTDWH